MNIHKPALISITLMVTIVICSFTDKSFARPGISYPAPSNPPSGKTVPPIPPHGPVYIYKWSITDVVKTFNEHGLETGKTASVTKADYKSLPARAKDAIMFTVPSPGENTKGCIFSFEVKNDMEKVNNYYINLNKKGELYSWSFVKDNILVVITGAIPEKKARQFERALNDIKK